MLVSTLMDLVIHAGLLGVMNMSVDLDLVA